MGKRFLFIGGPLNNTVKEITVCDVHYAYDYDAQKTEGPKIIEYRPLKVFRHSSIPETVFTCLSDDETLNFLKGIE